MLLLLRKIKQVQCVINEYTKKKIFVLFLFSFFSNVFSLQLGDKTNKNQLSPVKVMENVKSVIVGDTYSIALKNDKTLWGTGIFVDSPKYLRNTKIGIDSFFCITRNIIGITKNVFIDQQENVYSLKSDDYSFYNSKLCKITNDILDIDDRTNITAILKSDNTLWIKGKKLISIDYKYNYSENSDEWELVDKDVISFSCENDILIYVKKNNTVWMLGDNLDKRVINTYDRVIEKPMLIAKKMKSCYIGKEIFLISKKNELFKIQRSEFIRIDTDVKSVQDSFYIKMDGSLYAFGFSQYGALGIGDTNESNVSPTFVMKNVKKVKGNDYHSLILTNDNQLYSCGGGHCNFGCIGDGTTEKRTEPVFIMENVKDFDISRFHSMVIKNDGTLWAFGLNNFEEHELNL